MDRSSSVPNENQGFIVGGLPVNSDNEWCYSIELTRLNGRTYNQFPQQTGKPHTHVWFNMASCIVTHHDDPLIYDSINRYYPFPIFNRLSRKYEWYQLYRYPTW
jgi:hypothetical protein